VRVFGIDPGSNRTGYGCVETDGSRHRLVLCGAISAPALATFPEKLLTIHSRLAALLDGPDELDRDTGALNSGQLPQRAARIAALLRIESRF